MRIGIVHPGAMGAAVGRCLLDAGHDVRWASQGRSPQTRAAAAGLRDVGTTVALAADCELVISLCPPAAAQDVAALFADFPGVYVDANAIAPATARRIADHRTAGTFVDASVIGPPPERAGTTRLYVSGPVGDLAERLANPRLDIRVLDAGPTAASALKMSYAAWSKGSQALLLAARATAEELGVGPDLLREWAISQVDLERRSDAARTAAAERGWRWAHELEEIGRTFAAAGQPEGFGAAAADVFGRFDRPSAS